MFQMKAVPPLVKGLRKPQINMVTQGPHLQHGGVRRYPGKAPQGEHGHSRDNMTLLDPIHRLEKKNKPPCLLFSVLSN